MILKLTIVGNEVIVTGLTQDVGAFIDQVTRFRPLGYERTDKFRADKWDGWKRLFSHWKKSFPVGLIEEVEMRLLIEGIDYEVEDRRTFVKRPPLSIRYRPEHRLRDYQKEAIKVFLRKKRGIIALSCGTGKTKIGEAIIGYLKRPAVFYVGRKELLWDTVKVFKKNLGIPIGVVGDGKVDIKKVTVATVQTATNLPKALFTDFDITIFDECVPYDANITMADGTTMEIGKLVEMRLFMDVMSYNLETEGVERKPITRLIRIPRYRKMKKVKFRRKDGSIDEILCTEDHKLYVNGEYMMSKDIKKGDKLLALQRNRS